MRWIGLIVGVLAVAAVAVAVVVAADGGSDRRAATGPGTGAQPPPPRRANANWTYNTLQRRIAGERVRVGRRSWRVDPELVICNGRGRGVGRPARWARFSCTQATFARGITNDITFEVLVLGERRWRIVNARRGPG